VEGGERLRLFLALPLPERVVERLVAWQRGALAGARDARLVPPANLHVTLAFLGHRPAGEVGAIAAEMRAAAAAAVRPLLRASRYRETRSVGMVVLDDEGGRATALANDLAGRLEQVGVYEPERRPWLPHVTVLRFRRPPRLRPEPPDVGEVSPSEVALYTSVLRRTGAQYEISESVPLGG
jgi:RNA 2',3'-cyclic 3'-phosphodiesterase